MPSPRRALPLALLVVAATPALSTPTAQAAVCPGDLTVVGKKVTGSDCVPGGDGSVTILNPDFGASGAVKIRGALGADAKMVLNGARTQMVPENQAQALRLQVGDLPVIVGSPTIGQNEVCDVGQPRSQADLAGFQQSDPDNEAPFTGEAVLPTLGGCRQLPSFKFDFGLIQQLGKVAGLDLQGKNVVTESDGTITGIFGPDPTNLNSASFAIPRTFGFDDDKGGRVFGIFNLLLPRPFTFKQTGSLVANDVSVSDQQIAVGIGLELSAAEGVRPSSLGIDIPKEIPLPIPGVKVRDLIAIVDPANNRFGGGARVVIPGNKAFGGELIVGNGSLEKLGFDLGFPSPGVPLFPGTFLSAIGGTFTAAQESKSVAGATTRTPASVQGRFLSSIGPTIGGKSALSINAQVTIAGPTLKLAGQALALDGKLALGDAKVLIGAQPFRFEAEARASILAFLTGRVFVGLTADAFTGLGEVSIQIPKKVKFVGGQKLGGFQAAVSNVGAGGLLTVDPPLIKPFSLGIGTKFSPVNIDLISSLQPFITVKASSAQAAAAAASGRPVALAAAQRRLRLPGGDAIITVTGSTRVPRDVVVRSARGKKLKTVVIGRNDRSLELGVVAPKGAVTVKTRDAIRTLTVSRIGTFPYLDPSPGFGTRDRPPVTAGTPVQICWKTRGNVPRGTVVDLFEDQNGSLGTGRLLASGRAATGCLDIPTDGLEPGRHWAYGVVRVGDRLVGTRYWPIPITITDPKALPAPSGLQVVPTGDGATVNLPAVPGAASYIVTAEPSDEYAGEPVTQEVSVTDRVAQLSLRGAREWLISAQAVSASAKKGNVTTPVTVRPTDPVVLAGKPNGVAEVARKWAFQLDTDPGQTVRLVKGPNGMRIAGGAALLQWTPSTAAGRNEPAEFTVESCKGDRCTQRTFFVSAYAKTIAPFGPARGFTVSPNVLPVKGGTLTLRSQGIDEKVVVKIDGKVQSRVKRIDAQTVEVKVGRLAKGRHDVTLKIGGDLEERRPGAVVVL